MTTAYCLIRTLTKSSARIALKNYAGLTRDEAIKAVEVLKARGMTVAAYPFERATDVFSYLDPATGFRVAFCEEQKDVIR